MTRTYHLEGLRARLFYAVAGVMAVFGLVLGAFFFWIVAQLGLDLVGWLIVLLPVVVLGGIALAIAWFARTTRLELSERGVALRLPGATVEADWDDVETIAPAAWGPLTGDALRLRGSARTRHAWWSSMLFSRDSTAIPIAPFALPLRGSRLEADLRARLPELFEAQMFTHSTTRTDLA